jgi:hypothetical protein
MLVRRLAIGYFTILTVLRDPIQLDGSFAHAPEPENGS